jgi:TetR/AcrR family transcriptional regulator, acrAB operon repressor
VRRTKEDSERTRQQILVAARRQFALHGVTRTTLQRIATAAAVTRGAVYWHFANKLDVFRAMRDQVSVPLFDHTELLGTDEPDPLLVVERFLHGVIDQMVANLQTRRTFDILALKCEYVDEFRPELKRHVRRCHELMSKFSLVYQRARNLGALREDLAPETAALGTCVFITGLLRLWLMDEGGALLRPQVDALIASHVATLRPPAAAAAR